MTTLAKQETALIQAQPTVMEILSQAVQNGTSIDVIERLAALQRQMVEYDAKVSFDEAMHKAQAKMRMVSADAHNPQTKSRYATYAKLDSVLRPIYSEEGFSVSFDTAPTDTPDLIIMVAYVSHEKGHTRRYQLPMPADGKGAKGGDVMTKTHATGAASAYGMRYLQKMIWNVAVGDEDDDGNLGALSDDEQTLAQDVKNARTEAELSSAYREGMKQALAGAGNKTLINILLAAKNERAKQLREEIHAA